MILASFLGGLILFLYGQGLIETNLRKTSRLRLRSIFKILTKHRIIALCLGSIIAVGTQSSTVAVLTLVSFVNTGLLQLNQAVGLVLGASLGTTLVVQVISFDIAVYALWLIVLGFLISRIRSLRGYTKTEFLIGLGFMFFGIYLMGNGIAFFKETQLGKDFLDGICTRIIPNFTGAFLLTLLCQSTLLPMAVGITLMRDGGLTLTSAIPIILGAHLGASVLPLFSSWRNSGKGVAKQLALANLGYRLIGSLLFLPLIVPLAKLTYWITDMFTSSTFMSGRQLANAHTIFTLLTVGIFIPFLKPYTNIIKRLVPKKKTDGKELVYLNSKLKNIPNEILPAAKQEINRLIVSTKEMLIGAQELWEQDNFRKIKNLEKNYKSIHGLAETISKYITKLPKEMLNQEEYKKEMYLLGITSNLEKIGELIGRNLGNIATTRIRKGLSFSIEGLGELSAIHKRIIDIFGFLENKQIEKVLAETKEVDSVISVSYDSHINRMHEGFAETRETSSLHLDAINILERINNHILKIVRSNKRI